MGSEGTLHSPIPTERGNLSSQCDAALDVGLDVNPL
jgi:hypothetical protein